MKKILFIMPFLAVLLAANVFAVADITFNFNVNNVESKFYTCLDINCDTVSSSPFSYSGSTSNGHMLISFPSCLLSPFGYAGYFIVPATNPADTGYIPIEGIATFHTFCNPGHASGSVDIDFDRVANCASTIDEFTITNDLYANEPLQVNVSASLDAATHSAFQDAHNNVGYIPLAYRDIYYSADTTVSLTIKKDGQVVNQQMTYFDAAHGNPIFMDEVKDVEYSWVPAEDGQYEATVRTVVTDNQCSSNIPLSSSKFFGVLPGRPTNECYTIINGLRTTDPYPVAGDTVTVEYNKISNYANPQHALTSVPTDIDYEVRNSAYQIILSGSASLPANPNEVDPTTHSFQWVAPYEDVFTMEVAGTADSPLCDGKPNPTETAQEEIYVAPAPVYEVTFIISDDMTAARIQGATVSSNGQTAVTDSNGVAVIGGYVNGHYTYDVTHPQYLPIEGEFDITNADATVSRAMHKANTPPIITNIPDVSFPEDTVHNSLDLDLYVQDEEDLDADLSWTSNQLPNVGVSINPTTHIVTFTPSPGFNGPAGTVTFTVQDTGGLTDSDAISVTVTPVNDAPTISGLPDKTLQEDASLNNAFNLNDFASDPDHSDSLLTYSLTTITNGNKCGVTIDGNDNIDINPDFNFNGICDVTVRVEDPLGASDTDTFRVTVTPVNDAPVIGSLPDQTLAEDTTKPNAFNLNNFASDPDNTDAQLTYTLTSVSNTNQCGISIDGSDNVDIAPVADFNGFCDAVVRVTDPDGLFSEDTFRVTVTPINDPPNFDPIGNPISDETWNQGSSNLNAFDLDNYFTDPDGDALSYTASTIDNPNIVVTINPTTHVVSFTQPSSFFGVETVTFTADDGNGGTADSNVVTLTVVRQFYECNDGIDNDLDGDIDYPADLGCDSSQDDDESDGVVVCDVDLDCGSPYDEAQCSGLDFETTTHTPVCLNAGTEHSYCDETANTNTDYCNFICDDSLGCDYTECSDSVDNDFDNWVDFPDDWGCTSYFDDDE
ncbi:MAG: tandem-95 repeat protein, partial [Candidatus Woesearchaeota archaeon]